MALAQVNGLGKQRLSLIHPRVKHIAKTQGYHEKQGLKIYPLCEFCEYNLNEKDGLQWDCFPHSTDILIKCSSVTSVCESRSPIINSEELHGTKMI